jgi:hypothetical protein
VTKVDVGRGGVIQGVIRHQNNINPKSRENGTMAVKMAMQCPGLVNIKTLPHLKRGLMHF